MLILKRKEENEKYLHGVRILCLFFFAVVESHRVNKLQKSQDQEASIKNIFSVIFPQS